MATRLPETIAAEGLPDVQSVLAAIDRRCSGKAGAATALEHGRALAGLTGELGFDPEITLAAACLPPLATGLIGEDDCLQLCGDGPAAIVRQARKLPELEAVGEATDSSLAAAQAENLRKMLLAMVRDVRVIVLRLADQLYTLRQIKDAPAETQATAARLTGDIYAPLANRLGIWQLKWELEDLAFRYRNPRTYRQIARWLRERRADREAYIARVIDALTAALETEGLRADIRGRPKHIYSIWKKMQRKGVDFEHVYDVLAVRILVDTIPQCYGVLGVVHGLWRHIPKEFDDYIANPKDNLYQSLHTAVIGPEGRPVEIQIRTHEMHRHAELGVAAHWRYKEGVRYDHALEEKIAWMRRILEPGDGGETDGDFIDRFKSEIFEDRLYVLTPKGRIVDLPQGSTPLDFAYHIHTDIGHRCRGARVNGKMVPLTTLLNTGDQVEIITTREARPSRDWMVPQFGYLASSRARSKVRTWFRQQDREQNVAQGRALLERELNRLGAGDVSYDDFARQLEYKSVDDLLAALGSGDASTAQITGVLQRRFAPQSAAPESVAQPRRRSGAKGASDIVVEGVGNLLTHMARCCRPVPDDAIVGYITRARGVTIHRRDCASLQRLVGHNPERALEVRWGRNEGGRYPVEVLVRAYDRRGLLRDIAELVASEDANITALHTDMDRRRNAAAVSLTLDITGLDQLSRILHKLSRLPSVTSAQRRNSG